MSIHLTISTTMAKIPKYKVTYKSLISAIKHIVQANLNGKIHTNIYIKSKPNLIAISYLKSYHQLTSLYMSYTINTKI